MRTRYRTLGMCLAASLALAKLASAQSAPQQATRPPAGADNALVVEKDAPRGSSREVATGAVVGLVVGLFLVSLMVATAD